MRGHECNKQPGTRAELAIPLQVDFQAGEVWHLQMKDCKHAGASCSSSKVIHSALAPSLHRHAVRVPGSAQASTSSQRLEQRRLSEKSRTPVEYVHTVPLVSSYLVFSPSLDRFVPAKVSLEIGSNSTCKALQRCLVRICYAPLLHKRSSDVRLTCFQTGP